MVLKHSYRAIAQSWVNLQIGVVQSLVMKLQEKDKRRVEGLSLMSIIGNRCSLLRLHCADKTKKSLPFCFTQIRSRYGISPSSTL